jgi:CRISPR-associated protein Csd1
MELRNIGELEPVKKFYGENCSQGIDKISQKQFLETITKKERAGNIAILISGGNKFVHEFDAVYSAIISQYEARQKILVSSDNKRCSVCLESSFPVGDFTHFPVKGVPGDKEPAGGRKLISYNGENNPFESYEMTGNENCVICTSCAKTYVEGMNWLLSNGIERHVADAKGKVKRQFKYNNRKNLGSDSAVIFWTRDNQLLDELEQLDDPTVEQIAKMIEAITSGRVQDSRYLDTDKFYSCTISGSSARIAVRDWIETSLGEFRTSIAQWFKDIAIDRFDSEQKKSVVHYAPLYALAKSCQRKLLGANKYDDDDTTWARVASSLWKAAIYNNTRQSSPVPVWILTKILQRARADKYGVTPERAALIKLILNRIFTGGGFMVTEDGIQGEKPIAYICGEIFAKMESIQFAALGERNAGIREKFFSYAMTTPAAAFGRLFNLNSKHFTKLKHEKPGLAVNLDKELQELCHGIDINKFPAMFRLEEQGQFAIGYYHQRQKQFSEASNTNKKESK